MASSSIKDTLSGQANLLAELTGLALESTLDRLGMTMSSFELLSAIRASGANPTQADIARRLGITPPSLTEAVRHATNAGLVAQTPSPSDKRAKCLGLTANGEKNLAEILERVNQIEKRLVQGLDVAQVKSAIELLKAANRKLAKEIEESEVD